MKKKLLKTLGMLTFLVGNFNLVFADSISLELHHDRLNLVSRLGLIIIFLGIILAVLMTLVAIKNKKNK